MDIQEEKKALLAYLSQLIDLKIKARSVELESIIESRNNDTKSSAGDKFETGRAMMQQEKDKLESNLSQLKLQALRLSSLDISRSDQVRLGSLVHSDKGIFFLAIGLGKIEFTNKPYYVVSLNSPIGKILEHMKIGDTKPFQTGQITVKSIY